MKPVEKRCRDFRDQQRRDAENQLNTNVTRFSRRFDKVPAVATYEQPDNKPITLFISFNGDFTDFCCCERTQRYFNKDLGYTVETFAKLYKPYVLRSAEAAYAGVSLHRVRPAKDQMALSSCSVWSRGSTFEETRFSVCFVMINNMGSMLDQSMQYNYHGVPFKFSDLADGAGTLPATKDLQNQTA